LTFVGSPASKSKPTDVNVPRLIAAMKSGDRSWRLDAKCRGMKPSFFWPEFGVPASLAAALAVCSECPVRIECLAAGLNELDHSGGIWGGTTPEQRRVIRRKVAKYRRRVAA